METIQIPPPVIDPYPLVDLGDDSFHFITDQGNEYSIYFAKYWQQDLIDLYSGVRIPVYEFYFEVLAKNHAGMDKRIAPTIFDILDRFVIRTNSILFYITQRDDGRSGELFKVYQFWYKLYKRTRGDGLQKLDRVVYYGDTVEAHLSCLFMRDTVAELDNVPLLISTILQEIYPNSTVVSM